MTLLTTENLSAYQEDLKEIQAYKPEFRFNSNAAHSFATSSISFLTPVTNARWSTTDENTELLNKILVFFKKHEAFLNELLAKANDNNNTFLHRIITLLNKITDAESLITNFKNLFGVEFTDLQEGADMAALSTAKLEDEGSIPEAGEHYIKDKSIANKFMVREVLDRISKNLISLSEIASNFVTSAPRQSL